MENEARITTNKTPEQKGPAWSQKQTSDAIWRIVSHSD
jgi:hypothetical protein